MPDHSGYMREASECPSISICMACVCPERVNSISESGKTSRRQCVGLWLSRMRNIPSVPCMALGKIGKLGERRFSVVLNTYQGYAVALLMMYNSNDRCSASSSPYPFVALSDILNWQLLLFCYASGNKFRNHGCRERNTRHRGRGAARVSLKLSSS